MKPRAVLSSATIATLTALACSGCEGTKGPLGVRRQGPPEQGGTLTLANYADVQNLDPAVAIDAVALPILQLLFTPLVDYDTEGRIVPLLAERFEVSGDGLRYTFYLREGARFHDGEEITAEDVKRSFERALAPGTPCPAPSFYASLAGYRAFHEGTKDGAGNRAFADHIEGVVPIGRHVLRVTLSEPDATFLPALTLYLLAPVCRNAGRAYTRSFSNHPCGSGPFRLADWQSGREITLGRHAGYFEPGLPHLDRVRWLLSVPPFTQRLRFERGEIDHLAQFHSADLRAFARDERWRPLLQRAPAKGIEGVFLNTQMKPFDNVELRRAFAAAIDWKRVVAPRPEMVAATQMLPPAVRGHDPAFVGQRYDYAAALEHMKNAGYPFDPLTHRGGYPEAVTFIGPADTAIVETFAPIMLEQLAKIGIRVRIKQRSYGTYLAETSQRNRAQLGYVGWSMDYPDASDFFEPTLATDAIQDEGTQNRAFFSNREFDEILRRAHRSTDTEERTALYRRCEEIVRDEAPWAIGFHKHAFEVSQPYVHDYVVDAKHTQDVRRVWIDTNGRSLARLGRGISHPFPALGSIRPWGVR